MIKNPPEMQVRSLGWEDPLEESMPIHSSVLAWRIPWTEEPGGLWSTGSQRVRQNCSDLAHTHVGRRRITEAVGPKSGHPPSSAQNSSGALTALPSTAHKVSSHRLDSPPHCLALRTPCQPHHLPAAPGTQPAHVCHRAFALAPASAPDALPQTVTAVPFTSYESLLAGPLLLRTALTSKLQLLPLPLPHLTLPGPLVLL